MAKYKAYPEYKDSGVEWIDSIPSYWEVKPTFALCDASTQKNIDGAESNVLSLSYGNIIPRDVETNFGLLPESFNTYQVISCGDVILRLTDLQNDKNSLRVGLAKQKGIITSAYLKLKANSDINPDFLYRLLHSYDTTKVFYGMGGGLRQSMKFEDFRRLPLLLPPYEEQVKISAFLDHETAKIDNLIAKQQQLIELLKEKRQAVISHAVTKGLNPDVPMKDSGVEWLGEVPAHWDICLLKFKCSAITDGAHISPDTNEGEHYFVSIKDIKKGIIDFNNSLLTSSASYKYLVKTGCKPFSGDILFSKDGTIGQTAIVPDDVDFVVASSLIIIRADKEKVLPAFMDLLLQSSLVKEQVESFVKGAALRRLSIQNLEKVFGIFPTLSEQQIISDYIYAQLNRLDVLESKAVVQIQLLEERRTALISAAVTGKIDVRDWVAPDAQDVEAIQEATA